MQHQFESVFLLHIKLPTHLPLTNCTRHEHLPDPVEIQVAENQ